jgi:hypothetical protein
MRNNWTIHIEGLQGDLMLLIAWEDIVESSRAKASDHITVKLVSNRNCIKQKPGFIWILFSPREFREKSDIGAWDIKL